MSTVSDGRCKRCLRPRMDLMPPEAHTCAAITFLRESNNIEDVWDERSLEDAVRAWDYLVIQTVMTPAVVLLTHKVLMEHQQIENVWKGHFRQHKVYVGGSEAIAHERIKEHIDQWCIGMNAPSPEKKWWRRLHVMYEQIHPFIDGNGRTGRMFMNWYRLKNGDRIYVVKEADKQRYYQWFSEKI